MRALWTSTLNKNSPSTSIASVRMLPGSSVNQESASRASSMPDATIALAEPLNSRTSDTTKRLKRGAQGRIRTSVARKERQIYSLLPLTARPPVHNLFDPSHTQLEVLIASGLTGSHSCRGDWRQPPLVRCNLSWREFHG